MRRTGYASSALFVVAALTAGFTLGGCEAVLGVDSLTERGSGDGGGDSADATTADGGEGGILQVPEAGTKHDAGGDATSPEAGPVEGGVTEAGPEAGTCATGQADCDHNPANGCESTLASDPKNCGMCGHDCTALAHVSGSGVTCSAGACVVPPSACTTGYAHCSSNPDDGCEADLGTPQTCGTCTTSCSGATPNCSGGSCTDGCIPATLMSCSGSCVDTTSSPTNCGTCGNACPVPAHSTASCATNSCSFSCTGAFHQCGSVCADNTSPLTCGASCTPCPDPTGGGGMGTCAGGVCSFACDSTHHSCDGATCSSNGDTATCGTSCTQCPVPTGATMATCSTQGVCGVVCDGTTTHSCDNGATCSSNGSTATCGASCTACPGPVAGTGTTTCDGTNCGITCASGSHLCGGNSCLSDTSNLSCGASCTPCSVLPGTAGASCNAQETCDYTSCLSGYADCDGDRTNGCEVNLTDDGLHCGTCGHSCLGGACTGSVCQPLVLATETGPYYIAVDSTNVYFEYGAPGVHIGAVPISGGPIRTATAPSDIMGIAAFGGYVHGRGSGGDVWVIQASTINGQNVGLQVTDTAGASSFSTVITAGPNLATWIDPADDEIRYANVLGGVGSAVDLYRSTGAISYLAAAPDGFLVWIDAGSDALVGGIPTPVGQTTAWSLPTSSIRALGTFVASAVAVDGTYAYLASTTYVGASTRAGVATGGCTVNGATAVLDIVPDGTNVYFSVVTGSTRQIQKFGGPPSWACASSVVWTDPHITRLVADATALYWTDSSTNQVLKLAK